MTMVKPDDIQMIGDTVAIRWSDGVFQSELALEPGGLRAITETLWAVSIESLPPL